MQKKKSLEDFRNDFGYPKLNINPSLKIRTHLLLVGIYIFVLVLSTSDRNCLICLHSIANVFDIEVYKLFENQNFRKNCTNSELSKISPSKT